MSSFYLIVVWLLCCDSEFCRHHFFPSSCLLLYCGRRATLLANDDQTKQPAAIFCRCNSLEEDNANLIAIFIAFLPVFLLDTLDNILASGAMFSSLSVAVVINVVIDMQRIVVPIVHRLP
jgi:hypothetical protein